MIRKLLADPRILIPVASALGVASVALVHARRALPGPLAAVHERHPDLAGGRSCAACHGGWGESMGEACLACHAIVDEQLESGAGLHGRLGREAGEQCATCHSEHHGAGFALVNRNTFAGVGVGAIADFDHAAIGLELAGRHLELGCVECHANADVAVLPEGGLRYLGLERTCSACHEDPHEGAMQRDCTSCHDQTGFDALAYDAHDEHLALVGGHAGLDCRACHALDDAHALEALGPRGPKPAPRACADCHAAPHAAEFLAGAARLAGLPLEASCVDCHEQEHASFRDDRLALDLEQHAASGFPLDAPHDAVACEQCHASERATFAERYPGRGRDACGLCHDDPHDGQFAPGPFGRQGCVACHERVHFAPHAFTLELHTRTGFTLDGSHAELACDECHARPHEDAPRAFRGTADECSACHADAHSGYFERRAFELDTARPEDCDACHATTRFDELAAARFDHARWTGFGVRGAHEQEGCAVCHVPSAEPDELGRRFGAVPEHYDRNASCASCHADPHAGFFDDVALPQQVEGRVGCARCHEETSFRALPFGFDHAAWTGFALEGAHGAASCSACHPSVRGANGSTRAPAAGASCNACHEDPHAGQFVARGASACADCHAVGQSFGELVFDHGRDSRFPLDEAHAALACAACHRPFEHEGVQVARYVPLGTDCRDCHGDQRRPRLRDGGSGR